MDIKMNLFIVSVLIYLLIFVLPVVLYIMIKEKSNPFVFLKLKNNIIKNIFIGAIFCLIYILGLIIRNKMTIWRPINFNIGILWISVLLVGIVEEVPFRGFILQKLSGKIGFWKANIITTILFVLIHIPQWSLSGADIMSSAVSVFLPSIVFGYLFKEYDTLWIPIMCHSVFNMATWIGLK